MKEVRLTSLEKTAFKEQSCLIRVNLTKMKCNQNQVLKYIYIYIPHYLHFFTQVSNICTLCTVIVGRTRITLVKKQEFQSQLTFLIL